MAAWIQKMKERMGHARLRGRIFRFLVCFAAALLALLWLFQIVFLESFYKQIQTRTIKSTATAIARAINSDDLAMQVERLYKQSRISVRIVTQYGADYLSIGTSSPDSTIGKLIPIQLMLIYAQAEQNGGSTLELINEEEQQPSIYQPIFGVHARRDVQSLIYSRLVTTASGQGLLILLNSTISPVNTTLDTLRVQFFFIAVIMLLISGVLAFVMARLIARPIVRINDSAKVLATGDYDVHFEGGGYREVTELADTLNYAAGELGKVEQMRRDFIANVSHDLRTPLTMITGYGEVMRDLPGENTPENVQTIIDEAGRLTTLVNDLLDLSRLQSGNQKVKMQRINITAMTERILQRYATLIAHDGYRLSFEHEGAAWVIADETRLTQVVYNLINNAITYTGADKRVTVRQTVAADTVRIDVIDTGDGIAEADLPYIWDRYYKVDKAHRRAVVGTGLGLSIVKNVLELHAARYGVDSRAGAGSDFWFTLRRVPEQDTTMQEADHDTGTETRV